MSVWKKIPIAPGGVMPGGLVTKIGVAAISLLLAAMLLTYTFTGGGGPEAEVDVPEAAGFDLQQRAPSRYRGRGAAASRAAPATGRHGRAPVGSTTKRTGIECGPIGLRASWGWPVKTPEPPPFPTINPFPSEALRPAARPRPCCWKHCGSRKWSADGVPFGPNRLCCPIATPMPGKQRAVELGAEGLAELPRHPFRSRSGRPGSSGRLTWYHSPRVRFHGRRISPITHRTQRAGTGRERAARAGGPGPFSCTAGARDGNARCRPAGRSGRLGPYL